LAKIAVSAAKQAESNAHANQLCAPVSIYGRSIVFDIPYIPQSAYRADADPRCFEF